MSESELDGAPSVAGSPGAGPPSALDTERPVDLVASLRPFLTPGTEDEAAQIIRKTTLTRQSTATSVFSGPIPPATELAAYEEAHPGLADRIVVMAEREQSHRHQVEREIVGAESVLKRRGQPYALAALLLIGGLAFLFMLYGHAAQGAAIALGVIVLVTAMFLGPQILKLVSRRSKDADDEGGS